MFQKILKKYISNKNVATNIYRAQANTSIMPGCLYVLIYFLLTNMKRMKNNTEIFSITENYNFFLMKKFCKDDEKKKLLY